MSAGLVWSERDRPEPSTTRGVTPKPARVDFTTFAPAAVEPAPPNAAPRPLIIISAKKLSDGWSVRRAIVEIGGESVGASSGAPDGAERAPVLPLTLPFWPLSATLSCEAAYAADPP